jgi:hypothetical protein
MQPEDELLSTREAFPEPHRAFELELAPCWLRKLGEKGVGGGGGRMGRLSSSQKTVTQASSKRGSVATLW